MAESMVAVGVAVAVSAFLFLLFSFVAAAGLVVIRALCVRVFRRGNAVLVEDMLVGAYDASKQTNKQASKAHGTSS
jgi:uncharacterized membrane protein YgaE (UPF0421/DUF939 family)